MWTVRPNDLPRDLVPVSEGANLLVTSALHSHVRVTGIGRFFRARSVDVVDAEGVQVGDRCSLRHHDHYHVKRAAISVEGMENVLQELDELVAGTRSVASFQRALRSLRTEQAESADNVAEKPLTAGHKTSITSSTEVHVGDATSRTTYDGYVVEETILPLVDLLADDEHLVGSFVDALKEPEPGPAATLFLRGALHASHGIAPLDLLEWSINITEAPAPVIRSYFGCAMVDRASAVMIGTGNTIETNATVGIPPLPRRDFLSDLAEMRQDLPELALSAPPEAGDAVRAPDPEDRLEPPESFHDEPTSSEPPHPVNQPEVDEPDPPEPELRGPFGPGGL